MTTPHTQVRVDLGARGYSIHIGAGTLEQLPALIKTSLSPSPRRVALIADRGLPASTISTVESNLRDAGFDPLLLTLASSESDKSLATAQDLLIQLTRERFERSDAAIALGGGVIGDVAGFVAAIYRRGIPVIQCPTTLLAMVDASVGGKTGVNLAIGNLPGDLKKNMVGAFHQPAAVVSDTSILASLPDRHYRCGLAECIKHGMLAADWGDAALLEGIESNIPAITARQPDVLAELVTRNIRIKAAVVGTDELELDDSGGRMSLNLGHTFAHALETLPEIHPASAAPGSGLQHGEAVALGLIAASRTAAAMNLIPLRYADQITLLIKSVGLPTTAQGIPPDDQILSLMAHDKKVSQGLLRLILPTAHCRVEVCSDAPNAAICAGLAAIRQ